MSESEDKDWNMYAVCFRIPALVTMRVFAKTEEEARKESRKALKIDLVQFSLDQRYLEIYLEEGRAKIMGVQTR